ncbi:MAG: hypothetical protein JWM10_3325 [Myxococcaceae bacterium]|nr:hypothetical protein [Myxococcaceae bacterium]
MSENEQRDGMDALQGALREAAGRLRQYGRLAAARMFGTQLSSDGRYKAVVDLSERTLFTRAEMNAVGRLLIDKGVVTEAELTAAMVEEYRHLVGSVGKGWPELEVHEHSYTVTDVAAHAARAKREGWPR